MEVMEGDTKTDRDGDRDMLSRNIESFLDSYEKDDSKTSEQ